MYDNEDAVIILPYDGDMDDRVLEEMRPRFVVMYEPNPSFIRRVEVYPLRISSDVGISSFPSVAAFESLFSVLCQFGGRAEIPFSSEKGERCIYSSHPRKGQHGTGNSK